MENTLSFAYFKVIQASLREISLKHHAVVTTDTTGSPRALSVRSRCQVKYGERWEMFFYGELKSDLLDHVHFQTESMLASVNVNVGLVVHFRRSIDLDQLERDMEVSLGPRWVFKNPENWLIAKVN